MLKMTKRWCLHAGNGSLLNFLVDIRSFKTGQRTFVQIPYVCVEVEIRRLICTTIQDLVCDLNKQISV